MPPTCSVAPFDTASCTWASRFSAALRDTIGLYASSESSPAGRGVIAAARFTRAATKSSYTSFMTIIRLLELQAWPTFSIRVAQAVSAAPSTSGLSRMMYGSDPPSSSTTFLRLRPACAATTVPARSEPVSDTPRSRGSAIMSATCSWVAKMFV